MTMKPNPMVILTGPTAVGKTALSIALAKKINGAIISADSMQVYKYMDIGSAKIMPEEMDGVRHYLVDELDPSDEFHVVRFVEMAKQALKEITANGQIPIVVGGTGFYIQALLYDIDFTEQECDSAYRRQLEELAETRGNHYLHEMLKAVDPASAEAIHENNRKRVIRAAINERTHLVTIQRSKGYAPRKTLSVERIGKLIAFIKDIKPDVICMVDNCYGEFVEEREPIEVGADMIVGSLIKNPGGGLAPIGGYIVGKKECVENAAYRLTSPGLGKEVGASLGILQSFYQGLFLAPTVVSGALKGAIFAANIYEKLGFDVVPDGSESRHDIIQAISFHNPDALIAFCEGIQAAAPVDSYVTPEPWAMPGYDSDVIMAAGAFVQGSSIELSADGPIKPPYAVYFQGGLTWYHAKLGILKSLQKLKERKLVNLDALC